MKNAIAFLCYSIGLLKIIDWFVFCNNNERIDYASFKSKYIHHFPEKMQFLFNSNPELATVISIVLFGIAGFIFWKNNTKFFKIIAITSFLFASWNLFSLM